MKVSEVIVELQKMRPDEVVKVAVQMRRGTRIVPVAYVDIELIYAHPENRIYVRLPDGHTVHVKGRGF